ncbi:MAG: hypothetical protein AB1346_11835, partial [Thermodesulfobacteriota bacterium]
METFLPTLTPSASAHASAGSPAGSAVQGDRSATGDADASFEELFFRILTFGGSSRTPASAELPALSDGEIAELLEAGGEEIASGEDAGGDPVAAGIPAACLPAAVPPPIPVCAAPVSGGATSVMAGATASENVTDRLPVDPSASGLSAAPATDAPAETAAGGIPPRFPFGSSMDAETLPAPQAGGATPEAVFPKGAPAKQPPANAVPMESADAGSASAGDAPVPAAPRAAGARTDAAASGTSTFGLSAEPIVAAAKDSPQPRIGLSAAPPPARREGEPQAVPAVSGGKPSIDSESAGRDILA